MAAQHHGIRLLPFRMHLNKLRHRSLFLLAGLGTLLVLAGCSRGEDSTKAARTDTSYPGMEADLAQTLKQQADFYVFKTADDLTKETQGLKWEDGSDLSEFADVDAKKGGTMRIWTQDFPRTLRTVGPDANGPFRGFLLDWMQMPFVAPHPNLPGKYFPGLASSWTISSDGKTAFFRIDPAARWSDGQPVTTDDVVFSFYFLRSPNLDDPWSNDFFTKYFSRLTIYDKQAFALTMFEAKPDILDRAGYWWPFPRHAFGDFGPGWTKTYDWRIVPTTAPYELKESDIDKGQSLTMMRLKDWWARDRRFWRGRYNPDRLRFVVIRDMDKAFEAFHRGDLDYFPMTAGTMWYEKLPDSDKLVQDGYIDKAKFFIRIPAPDFGLWINESKPILNNRDVRVGIQYASDFQLVCDQYFRGDAVVQQTRNDGYGWNVNPDVHARPFDPAKAREHFAKAGFTHQGPDGVLTNDQGQRLSFRVSAYQYLGTPEILAIIKQQALKAGLELNIDVRDQTTTGRIVDQKNHEIAYIAYNRNPEMFPRYWEYHHGSNAYVDAYLDKDGKPVNKYSEGTPNPHPKKLKFNTNNITVTFIPELDHLIEQYDKAESMDDVKRLAAPIEQIIHDDASWVPGWNLPFFRVGYWRWVKWPKDFNVMRATHVEEFFLFWIDTDAQKETEEARRTGKTFPPQIRTFDQYKGQ